MNLNENDALGVNRRDFLKSGSLVSRMTVLGRGRVIVLANAVAAREAKTSFFQSGLQMRSDPQRLFLLPFIRSGALGKSFMARAQWHKKTSWRTASSNPEQEKLLNWRLSKETSLGLIGE